MNKKIANLNELRKKQKPQSLDDVARIAALHYFDPKRSAAVEEPIGLASGKTYTGGSFVPVTEDEIKADIFTPGGQIFCLKQCLIATRNLPNEQGQNMAQPQKTLIMWMAQPLPK